MKLCNIYGESVKLSNQDILSFSQFKISSTLPKRIMFLGLDVFNMCVTHMQSFSLHMYILTLTTNPLVPNCIFMSPVIFL